MSPENIDKQLTNRYLPYEYQGGKIYLNIQESAAMSMRSQGNYEQKVNNYINSVLKPGMTFIDVGVNKGYFTLIAAKIVGDSGKVLSFEPEPENCKWIKKSISLNNYENITLFEVGLGDKNQETYLYLGAKSGWHSILSSQTARKTVATIKVSMRTLDSILKEIKTQSIDLMKIDVEGAELMVLRGGRQTLLENNGLILLIELHPQYGVSSQKTLQYLDELGYSLYDLLRPERKIDLNELENYHYIIAKK